MAKQLLNIRPIINEKGKVLDDKEFLEVVCNDIKNYEERTGKPAPMKPKFRDFLFEMNEACTTAQEVVAYKNAHVVQQFDYDDLVKNTIRRNEKLKGGI